ncbi:MAG TPA: winged helix-turn-helix domain-containing protein [Pyrinomonadaceae bacterium]|nr:winged helix-turn-helix domain-containing protein [Pyrinomonadaceae bacterium]
MSSSRLQSYHFGPFQLDVSDRVLLREGESIALTPKAFDLLLALVESRGHLLSKETLIRQVWPKTFIEEDNLAVHISILRKVLGEASNGIEYIKTWPRRGYSFVAHVLEAPAEEISASTLRSMAVLPFRVISTDAGDDYLGVGMSDAIITRLTQLTQIAVRPTSAVLKYAAVEIDPVEAGKQLGVDAILSGRMTRAGDQIRVTVQLIAVVSNSLLWADKLDYSSTDVFTYEDFISEHVARALRLELSGDQINRLTKRHTVNSAAYWAYLKGRAHLGKRTPEGFRRAKEYFLYASEADPNYALAYSGLADCYTLLNYYGAMPASAGSAKAKAAALKAIEADEALSETHASMALTKLWYDWDWLGAEIEFERAIELNPAYATARQWYCWYLAAMGRFDESLAEGRRAHELDPMAPAINMALAKAYLFSKRFDELAQQCKRTLELNPDFIPAHYFLGQAYEHKGMYLLAVEEYRFGVNLTHGYHLGKAILAKAEALAGQTQKAKATLDSLLALAATNQGYVPAYGIALVCLGLGDKSEAIEWLNKAFDERFIWLVYLNVDPVFDGLRHEFGFKQLIEKMRFPDRSAKETRAAFADD